MSGGEIAAIVIGSITAIGVFLGPWLTARWQRRKREQEQKLRTHFEDLKSGIMEPMIAFIDKIKNFEGELGLDYNIMGSYIKFSEDIDFEKNELFNGFTAHFPEIARQWEELKGNILAHNQGLTLLIREIGDWITETTHIQLLRNFDRYFDRWKEIDAIITLYTGQYTSNLPSIMPSISETIPEILWKQVLLPCCQNLTPVLDLNRVQIKPMTIVTIDSRGKGCYLTYGSNIFAVTNNPEEAVKIKDCFITLQTSQVWVKKGKNILDNAKALEAKCKALKEDLNSTCEQYSKKYKKLERREDCPICKQAFNREKPWWKSLKFWS